MIIRVSPPALPHLRPALRLAGPARPVVGFQGRRATRAFDTGLQPTPFPDQAGGLLPGLLAATRTALRPADDDELTNSKIHHDVYDTVSPPVLLGARKPEVNVADRRAKIILLAPLRCQGCLTVTGRYRYRACGIAPGGWPAPQPRKCTALATGGDCLPSRPPAEAGPIP
jgi:hypothetical protein